RCGQHGDDHFDVAAGQFGDAGGGGGTGFDQAGDGALGEVGYGELMPCLEQVPGHRPAHVTQSYKANFHVVASLLLSGGWACCARRSRRGRRSYTPLWAPCPWAKGLFPGACLARRSQRGCCHYTPLWEPRPWATGLFPGRALHAVRSGGAAPTPLCGSPARGRKGCSRGRALHAVRSEGAAPTHRCGSPALGANGAQRAPAQLCLKFGWRFSTKACMPSVWSAVAKIEWNTRRSKRTPSARLVSNTRLTHSLVIITLGSDLLAMTWAVFRVSSSSWSTGKILATRPACSASRASIWRPVRHISMALALPMARVRRW